MEEIRVGVKKIKIIGRRKDKKSLGGEKNIIRLGKTNTRRRKIKKIRRGNEQDECF